MRKFFKWFALQWEIKSDWVPFTYGLLGIFAAFEVLSQIVNGPGSPRFLLFVLGFYLLIACPIGYFTRNNP